MNIGYRPIGHHHMVSAGHALAARAADQILEDGGNAVDAGVAGGLALGVVQSDYVNVAGVAPIMIRTPEGKTASIDGLGGWPAMANAEVFHRNHDGKVPRGILRTVVPGSPSSWIAALEHFGTKSFGEVAAPAIRLAREGFAMHWLMHQMIAQHVAEYTEWPSNASIYLPNGQVPEIGALFRQTELAASLQYMADEEAAVASGGRKTGLKAARDAFYRGDIAVAICRFHEEEGGWLRAEDLADYESEISTPLSVNFAKGSLLCSPAWCQGPHLGQIMVMFNQFDWTGIAHNGSEHLHRVIEVIKLAFADREAVLGDPRYVEVPVQRLLSEAYACERLDAFDAKRAEPGMPTPGLGGSTTETISEGAPSPGDTSYIAVTDASGWVFSATPSDVSYNSPVVPGTGLCPSSRGSASWVASDHPSSVAPGKRPRLTPNPAIWIGSEGQVMPFGTPGGDVQIQAMAQFLLNHFVFGMDLQESIEAPRLASYSYPSSFSPHGSHPGLVRAEARLDSEVIDALSTLGHRMEAWPEYTPLAGAVCAVERRKSGEMEAGYDPRRPTGMAGR